MLLYPRKTKFKNLFNRKRTKFLNNRIFSPNFKDFATSTHHFNANEHVAVVDFARSVRLKEATRN